MTTVVRALPYLWDTLREALVAPSQRSNRECLVRLDERTQEHTRQLTRLEHRLDQILLHLDGERWYPTS